MSDEVKLCEEICVVGVSLYVCGYVVGSVGNISVCLYDGWLIMLIDVCFGWFDLNDIVKVGVDGQFVLGGKLLKMFVLYCGIYVCNVVVNGVVYMYLMYFVVLMFVGVWCDIDVLLLIMLYYVMKVGYILLICYCCFGDLVVVVEVVVLVDQVCGVLFDCFGFVMWGLLVLYVLYVFEEFEEIVWLWLMMQLKLELLFDVVFDELCQIFGVCW